MLMRQMRQNTKIIMLVTALAFVALMVFEWGMDMSGQTAGGDLGRVGRTTVTVQEFQDVYRNLYDQIQRSQDQPITSQQNREIEDMAWDEVVNQILIRTELSRRGIRVSDDEIRQAAMYAPPPEFRSDPAFLSETGEFDIQRYHQFLNQASQDPLFLRQLEQYYREMIPREKLVRQVTSGIFISDRELWERWKAQRETAEVTAVAISPELRIPDSAVEVTRADVERYYRDNRESQFALPARAEVRFTYLDKTPTAADSAEVRDLAESLRQEILEGGSFAEIAERESADQAPGGNLGTFQRGDLLPELDEAAFSLPVGELSEPIRTIHGLHLLEVLSREEDEDRAEARHILVPMERTTESEIRLLTRADSLETMGTRQTLDEAAAHFGLEVLQGEITEDFAFLSGVGLAGEGQDWIFVEGEGPGAVSPLFENEDAFYMFEILRVSPAGYLSLEDVAAEIERDLRAERKLELALDEARAWSQELRSGATTIEALAERLGVEPTEAGPFTRQDFVPGLGQQSAAIGAAFGTPVGGIAGPVVAQGNVILLRVDGKAEGDREAWEAQKEMQRMQVTAGIQQERLGMWLEGLRETTRIVDNRAAYFRALEEQQDRPQIPMAF